MTKFTMKRRKVSTTPTFYTSIAGQRAARGPPRTLGRSFCGGQVSQERQDEFTQAIEYDNKQHRDELMPLYRKMVALFTENIGHAEPETRVYFPVLVSFVEVWERWMQKALPPEALEHLNHTEENLKHAHRR